ncbi:DUF4270 domain-containing protein [Winogradskyella litorisediminis]|uniref:DUF4270 domain-containing protein n=1 Tax=Winogradskyella litorisediminis TaxID=1156618 RepID=A0ABW3N4A0_9FLAO
MKLKKIALRNFAILSAIALGFVACDDDFTTLNSDIINDETATNFNATSERYDVISYTDVLEPVQTSGLGLNLLGLYDDPTYGRTIASLVTQVNSGLVNPTFGSNAVLDSVVFTIPFFSTVTGVSEADGIEYELDSVISTSNSIKPIKLSIFENSYFLRDFDPNLDFNFSQIFFSNKSASENELISASQLEAVPIAVIDPLEISNEEIVLTEEGETSTNVTQRLSPRIRKVWNRNTPADINVIEYWNTKILAQEGETVLSNTNNFNDYFRGLYFKAEPIQDEGSMLLLNLNSQDANITLHYSFDSPTVENQRDKGTYVLTFNPTRVNFFENDFNSTFPQQDGDDINGDENLYLKGGEGSLATIKLFNGDQPDDDNTTDNAFETWRKEYVNVDEDGEFVSAKRLVNEANLIFYVNQDEIEVDDNGNTQEPNRLYLYNKTNGLPLIDYSQDAENQSLPELSIRNHLGILEREETTDKGIRYKMRITSHINNMLLNNAGNVDLGLAVSLNVNLEASLGQFGVQTNDDEFKNVPVSSIISPRGTVLYGNATTVDDKKLVLEIFYTEPE